MEYSDYPNTAGIYKLICKNTGLIYIGKSVNIRHRLRGYKNFKGSSGKRYHFLYALLKYGWDSFKVEILETLEDFDKIRDNQLLLEKESYYINIFDSTNPNIGYNICKFSTDATGRKCSELTKKKIGNSNRGRVVSDETRQKQRVAHLGRSHSKETREKMSQKSRGHTRLLGFKSSDETKEKIRQARLGRKHSEESKEKMRKPKVNRENLGKSFLGKKHTEESKEKMRKAKLKQKEDS